MANAIPPPVTDLVRNLLACLPVRSPGPPPALLPLLSPILRQRVQLLSDTASSPSDSWLTKLTWDRKSAEGLPAIVESEAFQIHPVSNEIEYGDAQIVGYRRLDEETLHSRIDLRDLDLTVIYLWCVGDEPGGGDGWRVAEVLPFNEGVDAPFAWRKSIEDANDASRNPPTTTSGKTANGVPTTQSNAKPSIAAVDGEDEDDDYWAQYDNAPTSTPGPQPSPGPQANSPIARHGRALSDADYYSRYSAVQPDMDNDDPSADRDAIGESSLNGEVIAASQQTPAASIPPPTDKCLNPNTNIPATVLSQPTTEHPRPQTASSDHGSTSSAVDRLEDSATLQSKTELAVRQHVASTMKSLYRLARSTGMELAEFEGLIKTEVEMLSFEEGMEEG
ncbi:MAG: hypothetical protein L6R39_003043 [Caloplaca ligustica]|nr:MAG: hypothetical protein L6R39_003043 [Caloplaca ligustica]